MQVEKEISYIRFIVRELSFEQFKDGSKKQANEVSELKLKLGYGEPSIEQRKQNKFVAMPFKCLLQDESNFTLSCLFDLGFEVPESVNTAEEYKKIVNENKEYFLKYIKDSINKIISSAMQNTAFQINEVFDIPPFEYNNL
ncbi:hypothetical protein ACFHYN_02695 [Pasteurella multocida]|uniref:hypothetical protein n=1 Tax=Pasteurella multocida TaxID=747 RepID=UPI002B45D9D6|nr:hypothetical protein [Pasteurella multocida]MEB3467502.1 hypothetical protein [Pasteurella multocida]WRK06669.1 hypothetical protein RFF38_08435 [Pasteurella multocida]HDR1354572.1 hypothetical protein [Pasteurella multocida]